MNLITFNAYRALGLPGVRYLRPESFPACRSELLDADWLLFPEYWQVNALVYAMQRRIFPSPASYHLGHDKIEMTRALQAAFPAHVPETLILPANALAVEQALDVLGLPLVAKVPRSSMGRGVALIDSAAALRAWAAEHDVLYVQEVLPAQRDLRVVYVGDRVVTAYWREGAEGAFHNNVARGGRLVFDDVPDAAVALVGRMARHLGIDHAGFDLLAVGGHFYVLEFNVFFGNEGLNAAGVPLARHILDYLRDGNRTPPGDTPLRLAG
ncbi:hypothetical protein NYO91_01205 [Arhodomonas aquaeolei]|uniref:ATP-grasp domain-containing protein n=1 Tax=Arhodomonas aquaeolei TaxID=2369 RepID=UPI002168323F|nr:hypothetical protein [Arhodomonas aquaeolei]MCS4502685.1 hypothetical protein [Arhodomonas aquaeolei]